MPVLNNWTRIMAAPISLRLQVVSFVILLGFSFLLFDFLYKAVRFR